VATDSDEVFKALADPTRRLLLDRLRDDDGQTLSTLCGDLGMTRQSATQHLGVLEAANLVSSVRRGREKLHYLNPVPIHELQARWIDRFAPPRLQALRAIKQRAEDTMADRPTFRYVTYIEASPEAVWDALTDADATAAYWGHSNVSDWAVGSAWNHVRTDGSGRSDVTGTIVESDRPRRLVCTWADPDGSADDEPARVTYAIEPHGAIVRLTVTHVSGTVDDTSDVSQGWPAVLSNLKTYLESGKPLAEPPWEMASS